MKYRHISAHLQRFVVLMLVINHERIGPVWLIPPHQNDNRADIQRQLIFYFDSNKINNELKWFNRLLLLAHADSRFTSVESEQPETQIYKYRLVQESCTVVYRLINTGILCLYRQKHGSC